MNLVLGKQFSNHADIRDKKARNLNVNNSHESQCLNHTTKLWHMDENKKCKTS